jgi:dTDP-4-dehydrorhamnose 3,5-epimerase
MKIAQTSLQGLTTVESSPFSDNRGVFSRLYCERELSDLLAHRRIVQINHSLTRKSGAIRGLHYQRPPHAEMKFVRCLKGRVWDVAVDLREGSPTFLRWHAEELTSANTRMLAIPEGFAHGFQTLEDNCELLYLHTEFYTASAEQGVSYQDPRIQITWPFPVTDLSQRDASHPTLLHDFAGLRL